MKKYTYTIGKKMWLYLNSPHYMEVEVTTACGEGYALALAWRYLDCKHNHHTLTVLSIKEVI